MDNLVITSPQNPRFKRWRDFIHHPEATSCPWLPLSGAALADYASRNEIGILFLSERSPAPAHLVAASRQIVALPTRLMARLSDLDSPPAAIGLVEKPQWAFEDLGDFVLVAAGIQDPGNLGSLVRTANATGGIGLASMPGSVSFFNAKVVRAAAGALFSTPCVTGIHLKALKSAGYGLIGVERGRGDSLFDVALQAPSAFLLGSEGAGLSEDVASQVDQFLHVPMRPEVDSLNVGVAGALIAYELYRRVFGK